MGVQLNITEHSYELIERSLRVTIKMLRNNNDLVNAKIYEDLYDEISLDKLSEKINKVGEDRK